MVLRMFIIINLGMKVIMQLLVVLKRLPQPKTFLNKTRFGFFNLTPRDDRVFGCGLPHSF
nr:hypothetical protein [Cressdnaviricota sp.]